jgi:hypothetical protein
MSDPAALSRQNADMILALTKMGIYLERDNPNLDKLKPLEKHERIKRAFDQAVENCCIFPLLFTKREIGPGKLVPLDKPQWEDWKDGKGGLIVGNPLNTRLPPAHPKKMEAFVKGMGTDSTHYVSTNPDVLIAT